MGITHFPKEGTTVEKDEKRALFAVLNLLSIDCQQAKLKLAAVERMFERDPFLKGPYQSELQSLRSAVKINATEQALEALQQRLFDE